ncbi:Hsp70 family protein [Lachnospiraceae bacterium ASD3451]|uniref:Hsp70 family protein n=1 Tax=Diplocloster agilis TaxID=2850323 RepID=UPI001D9B97B1|nr:Hsp70 family protein [Diplocloster agilis]MBU9745490.1 Hsp70 family protein [Diplocloster agilis]
MATKRIIGIDFGTSTSVIRVKRYGEDRAPVGDRLFVNNVLFDGRDSVPTLVQLPDDVEITQELQLPDDECEFGYYAAAEQPGMTICRNFKVELESARPDIRMRAKWLTGRFFQYLYEVYQQQKNQLGDNADEEITYVSYPAKYKEENRQFMIEAAAQAGFKNVKGITEPEAAVRAVMVQEEKEMRTLGLLGGGCSYLLFLDMGAGTTDIAVCRYEKDETRIISTWPDQDTDIYFGGKDVDHILTGYIERYLREHRDIVPEYFIDSFSDKYIDNIKTWKETTVSRTLKRGKSIPYFQTVKNPYPSLPDFSPAIDREEFERACTEYLKNFAVLVNGSLAHTQSIVPEFPGGQAIDLVILTGGHSQWYFITEMLEGKRPEFGSLDLPKIRANPARIFVNGKPQETVAVGMAYEPLRVIAQSIPNRQNIPGVQNILGVQDGPGVKSGQNGNMTAAQRDLLEKPKKSREEIIAEMSGRELYQLALKEPDRKRKLRLFREAAEKGESHAMYRMGNYYQLGLDSVAQDYGEALKWYQLAADRGNVIALEKAEQLRKDMPAQAAGSNAGTTEDTRMSYSANKAAGRVIPSSGLSYTVNDMLSWLPAEVERKVNRWNNNPGLLWKYYEIHYKQLSSWSQKLKLQLQTDEVPILYLNRKGAERGDLIEYGLIFTNKRIHWRFDFLYKDSIFYKDIVDIKPIAMPDYLAPPDQASDRETGLAVRHFYMEQNARKIKTTNIWLTYTEDHIIPEYQLFEAFFKEFRAQ